MKIVSRHILSEIAWPSILAFVVICFIGAANELRERSGHLDLDLLTTFDLVRLVLFFVPTILTFVLPVTFMMGILLAFGSFAETNQITAMRAAGIPLKRLILPVVGCSIVLSVFSFVLVARVQPWAVQRTQELLFTEILLRGTIDALPAGKMHAFGGRPASPRFNVYFAAKDEETMTLHDVDIMIAEPGGRAQMIHAESAQILYEGEGPVLRLREGYQISPQEEGYLVWTINELSIEGPQAVPDERPMPRAGKTLETLFAEEENLTALYEETRNPRITSELKSTRRELAARFALPLACFAVAICATPLAVRSPRGGRSYSFFVGVAVAVSFYVLLELFDPSGLRSLETVILRWLLPSIILSVAGLFFLWRVDRV